MIFKALFGSKFMWWAIGALLLATAASGYAAKRYYDKSLIASQQIEMMEQAHAAQQERLQQAIDMETKRYEALTKVFGQQQKDYAKARKEVSVLRGKISGLKSKSPEIKEYLDTPVPDALYDQLFPPDKD